ncbi:MAG: 7-cyano-7-deazaguanine synthase QueC [Candidatus Firestonebacteria bacterium]|nr:7-cyano-7-deazaguanine synthase QueC [Candidatus Firestonebacteria bacterium]
MTKKALVLLSGGLDSATTLAIAKKKGYELFALTFDYGQRHKFEIKQASIIAKKYFVKNHKIIKIDMRQIGGSALTDNIPVPENKNKIIGTAIPITYVPARNTIFLSFALAWAEVLNIQNIFIGVNAIDFSGYPDCRPAFIKSFERMANLATKTSVLGNKIKIVTPLINLKKSEIIKLGNKLGVDYSLTNSCYNPDKSGNPCGKCDSCILRAKGFKEASVKDPALRKYK